MDARQTLTTTDRLRAELAFNAKRADHEPVTDSSLTFGDLRAVLAALVASPHNLVELLREAEPEKQPDGSDTLMEITVDDARKIAWALLSGKPLQTSDTYREALESIDAVGVDFGHFETAARTMQEIARKALFPSVPKAGEAMSDEDRIAYWKGAYERMAARNANMDRVLRDAAECLDGEPEYHYSGMGCGLEDRSITDRYEAMRHGWDCAMERFASEHVVPARDILRAALKATGG